MKFKTSDNEIKDIRFLGNRRSGILYKELYRLNCINRILNDRVNMTTELLFDIRGYLIECKKDKSIVDVDKILNMLD